MTKTILAIDVGTKRIGVAGTDALGITVQPIEVITRKQLEDDAMRICTLIQERQVGTLVVGLPLRGDDGEIGFQAQKVREFMSQVNTILQREGVSPAIVEWDESMTTHDAEEKLREAGVRRARRGQMIDAMAAVAILESYLRGNP
ncbi:MAG: Holliday junction resolvase RuvX [Deltaproteobacteria bacterium CG11_big_fil_rev_8_21_14_0_20_47_16]|nr:MAG: Holliday junction resolvase RuvX [Deltaproteobacteria bacterium CG11_big_fil_rev_8_21_14_0_20_47_16]